MAIHTIQLVSKPVSYNRYNRWVKRMHASAEEKLCRLIYNKNGVLAAVWCGFKGIVVSLVKYTIPHLTVTLNPSIMLGGTLADLCDITASGFDYCASVIDCILSELDPWLICGQLTLSRIDCTLDTEFPNEQSLLEYILCIQHTNLPRDYERQTYGSQYEDYKERNQHSFRAACQGVTLTVYDKGYQLAKEELMPEIEVPTDRLRFEASIQNRAFQNILSRCGASTAYLSLKEKVLLFSGLSVQIVQDCFRQALTPGEYMDLDSAVQKIKESNYSSKVKKRMVAFLHEVSRCHKNGIRGAIRAFKEEGYAAQQVNAILQHFRDLGLNPATIRGSSGFDRLPSISELLEEGALPASISAVKH